MPKHTAVWIDHHEAHVFHLDAKKKDAERIPLAPKQHAHHQSTDVATARPGKKKLRRFFRKVGKSLEGKGDILLVGPATTKLAFLRYAHKHHRRVDERIVGIETVAKPTASSFLSYAMTYFTAHESIE